MKLDRFGWGLLLGFALLPALAGAETWSVHTDVDRVTGLREDRGRLLAATSGGLVVWELDSGIPQIILAHDLWDNSLHGVAVTRDGRPWVATEDAGLAWQEGQSWHHLGEAQGLPVTETRCVMVDSQDRVWGGLLAPFRGYLVCSSGGEVDVWGPAEGMNRGAVLGMDEAADGTIYLACKRGPLRFDGQHLHNLPEEDGLPSEQLRDVACGADGSVWFATSAGLARLQDGEWSIFQEEDGLPSNEVCVVQIQADRVWTGTEAGAAWWDGADWHAVPEDQIPPSPVRAMASEAEGGTWIGTFRHGIYLWRDGVVEKRLAWDQGPPDNYVRRVEPGPDGVVWSCSESGGLGEFDGRTWQEHTGPGIDAWEHRAVNVTPDGVVWVSTYGGGFHRYDGMSWQLYDTSSGLPDDHGMFVAQGPDGRLWFATANAGVSVLDGDEWNHYDMDDGLTHWRVYQIQFEPPDRVWFATDCGVSVLDATGWTSYNEEDGLAFYRTYSVDIDSQGVKWFGSCAGLTRFDGQTWTQYYPETSGLPWFRCNDVEVDTDDSVWIGTGMGLAHFDPFQDVWTVYTPQQGLPGWDVSSVVLDRRGDVWVGCRGGGIGVLRRTEIQEPRILAAGGTVVQAPDEAALHIEAVPWAQGGPDLLRSVEIWIQDIATGLRLRDDGTGGDAASGDGVYTLEVPLSPGAPPGRYGFDLRAVDYTGARGPPWPRLPVE